MKLGPMEGTPDEVKDFAENLGLNLKDYVTPKKQSIVWVVVPAFLFLLCMVTLILCTALTDKYKLLTFVLGVSASVWLTLSYQIRFQVGANVYLISLCGLILMLVALGVITPIEALEKISSFKK